MDVRPLVENRRLDPTINRLYFLLLCRPASLGLPPHLFREELLRKHERVLLLLGSAQLLRFDSLHSVSFSFSCRERHARLRLGLIMYGMIVPHRSWKQEVACLA